jgi:hypothetical protein
MGLKGTWPQMSGQLELPLGGRGEAPSHERSEEVPMAAHETGSSGRRPALEYLGWPPHDSLSEPPGADPHAGWCGLSITHKYHTESPSSSPPSSLPVASSLSIE